MSNLGCIPGAQTGFIDFNNIAISSNTLLTTLSKETPSFKFTWSTRPDRPQLSQTPGLMNLTTEMMTSINYNQREYYLRSIQFAQVAGRGTHTPMITPATNQSSNKEDVILTFTNENIVIGDQQHIVIIVPIIRQMSGLSVDPDYLHRIYTPNSVTAENPITIDSLIPNGPYTSYTICVPRIGSTGSNQNIMILVSMYGLHVLNATMLNILQSQTLSRYVAPPSVIFMPNTATTAPPMVIYNDIVTTPLPPPEPIKTLKTDALKCVPLDPEKQIENGKIRIDASTGKPLDAVQASRLDTMASTLSNTSSVISPQTFIKATSLTLGVLFFLCIVYFVVAFCMNYFIGGSYAGSQGPVAAMTRSVSKFTIPAYFTTGIFMGLAGVLVGYLLTRQAV
jgi:hypothetical protein